MNRKQTTIVLLLCSVTALYAHEEASNTETDSKHRAYQEIRWEGDRRKDTIALKMPGAAPPQDNTYYHTAFRLPDRQLYITGYTALTNSDIAHHMLVFGCAEPGGKGIWEGGPCEFGASRIIFAWAKNAPPFKMPKDVAIAVGKGTRLKYIVVEIHYKNALPDGAPSDTSGIAVSMTQTVPRYLAGILLLAAGGSIPPHKQRYHVDVSCRYYGSTPIHPFAARVHAHDLATVISGYVYHDGAWSMIAKGNPQWPQAFYPLKTRPVIKPNNQLFARCTYNSTTRNTTTYMGATGHDEMCNLYIMYYKDSNDKEGSNYCMDNSLSERQKKLLPGDSDVPLPRNPALESMAHSHMAGTHHSEPKPKPKVPIDHKGEATASAGEIYHYFLQQWNITHDRRFLDIAKVVKNGGSPDPNILKKILSEKQTLDSHEMRDNIPSKTKDRNHQQLQRPQNSPLIDVQHWPKSKTQLGQIGGVATDSKGFVYVFHRASTVWDYSSFNMENVYTKQTQPVTSNPILVYTPSGRLLREWGQGKYYMPHGITVDHSGNIWLTDVALHQVFRIPAGKTEPDLTLGTKFKPGKTSQSFCKPADVAVLKDGRFFVADGYCNSRIVMFSKDGEYIKEWGKHKSNERVNNFNHQRSDKFAIVHSLTIAEDKGLVCAADRENGLIQCFDFDGNFKQEITSHDQIGGKVFAIDYCPLQAGLLFVVNGNDGETPIQGVVIMMDTGGILGTFKPSNGSFQTPHDISVHPGSQSVYVGEIGPNKVWKFTVNEGQNTIITATQATQDDSGKPIDHTMRTTPQSSEPTESPTFPNPVLIPHVKVTHGGKPRVGDGKHHAGDAQNGSRNVAVIVSCLLVIPIVVLFVISVSIKLYKERSYCCRRPNVKSRVFNLGTLNYFNSHKGFNKVSLDESDHEIDPLNESDEEYSAPPINSKPPR